MSRGYRRSDPPHLLWVYDAAPDVALGVTTRLEMTRELRELGWRITLLLEGPAGKRIVQGVEVFCFPKPRVYFLGYCLFHLRLLRYLVRARAMIDVILFHQMSAPWVLPLRFVRRLNGGQWPLLVMDTRDVVPNRRDPNLRTRLRTSFHKLAHWLANRLADGQTVITQRMAELMRIPPKQLWGTWPSGVNPDRFAPAQIARRWPAEGEPIRLAYIGVLLHERNLMTLVRAVEKANAEGMAFGLSIIGEGPERLALERVALHTAGRIRVVPPVPHDQVAGLLAQAHVGVLPFPDIERFQGSSPLKLFEYMAAGLPILATSIVCHTDVVGRGEYAFWAEDHTEEGLLAAIRNIWASKSSLRKKGEEASKAAERWTWHEAARKLKVALEEGIAKYQLGQV